MKKFPFWVIFSRLFLGMIPNFAYFLFLFIEVNSLVNDVTHNKWGGSMSFKGFLGKFMSSSRSFLNLSISNKGQKAASETVAKSSKKRDLF
jgi:hypothetical protein